MRLTFRKLDVEDLQKLEQLVTDNAEAIESGIEVIGTRLLFGHSKVDLVGVDARRALVLVALAFTGDDTTLLRMMDAYSWCLEYPDSIRQLYPSVRLDADSPPRVVLIAERMPDTFLRKVSLLNLPELGCFEFRYIEVNGAIGFYLEGIDVSRRSAGGGGKSLRPERVAPPPDRAEKPVARITDRPREGTVAATPTPDVTNDAEVEASPAGPPPEAPKASADVAVSGGPKDRPALPQGLHLPENAELAPQWRHFLDKLNSSLDESKVRTVREYFRRELPECSLYDFYDLDRAAQAFHFQNSHGELSHIVFVAEDFLEERNEKDIRKFFDHHKVGQVLRSAGPTPVAITKTEVSVEGG